MGMIMDDGVPLSAFEEPYDWVTEQEFTASLAVLALVERAKRKPTEQSFTNPVHITCREGHETGLAVKLGTRDGNIVLRFRQTKSSSTWWEHSPAVAALAPEGPLGHGTADRSKSWRLFCPQCGEPRGHVAPEWVLRAVLEKLAYGQAEKSRNRREPRLRMNWT